MGKSKILKAQKLKKHATPNNPEKTWENMTQQNIDASATRQKAQRTKHKPNPSIRWNTKKENEKGPRF
ncbi:MAG: hypothetical protein US69_C0007G0001 [candidate division TM6 bacterium GW2011_GWF2_38_10]|nr:MAG: hypothetical protein US69_C0007G0001 [candidate division TM6 bacterium GW2011_GWF2_38_10]